MAHERVACGLMVLSGAVGLVLTMFGQAEPLQSWIPWATWNPRSWLVAQSVLVVVGGLGAFGGASFTLAMAGISAAVVFVTPVGVISVVPGVFLLGSIALRWRGFPGLAPRWRGGGRPPPGYWR